MKEMFKIDNGNQIPITKVKGRSEGREKALNLARYREPEPPSISESVGENSLKGWVRKNINEFEPTEGRL